MKNSTSPRYWRHYNTLLSHEIKPYAVLITRTDFALARELVLGMQEDLLPEDERFWKLAGHTQLTSFDDAARQALANE